MAPMASSGEERKFSTGAVRDGASKKPMIHLISPFFLRDLGEWLRFACKDRKPKPYPPRNWERGMPFSETLGSGLRHVIAVMAGETTEDNFAAIGFMAMALSHYRHEIAAGRMDPALDDLPKYGQQTGGIDTQSPVHIVASAATVGDPQPGDERQGPNGPERYVQYAENPYAWKRVYPALERYVQYAENPVGAIFYICGPMTGLPNYNFAAFDKARDLGLLLGYDTISPADMDREVSGIDILTDPEGWKRYRTENPTFLDHTIDRDMGVIRHLLKPERGDGLALLPGWQKSKGANAEISFARWRGLKFVDAESFLPIGMEL